MWAISKQNQSSGMRYESIDKQISRTQNLLRLAETRPLRKRATILYSGALSLLPLYAVSFVTWRAGFRGFGLSKYGRSRGITAFLAFIYPLNGGFANQVLGADKLIAPYRREDPWYYAGRFALNQQIGHFAILTGNIFTLFLFATRGGSLPIPAGIHKPGLREVAVQMLLKRLKPYYKGIAMTLVGSSVYMFALGYGAYHESCVLLAMMDRKTLGQVEEC